ncbi:hypothetical protein E2C01_038877 [Portunus trituberculatus]|uniref:Uncharacterized protein n=1 Tax=Portunus trituberculatus TaxID=210409 RepID=A0A5B7FI28_PORTR|nr:hypothetical protein [Portunus trituberculatus]
MRRRSCLPVRPIPRRGLTRLLHHIARPHNAAARITFVPVCSPAPSSPLPYKRVPPSSKELRETKVSDPLPGRPLAATMEDART